MNLVGGKRGVLKADFNVAANAAANITVPPSILDVSAYCLSEDVVHLQCIQLRRTLSPTGPLCSI
jgi:hypothetical protein